MKCIECDYAVKGFFACEPDKYVCIGVKEPFAIEDPEVECTEYPERRDVEYGVVTIGELVAAEPAESYVDDNGIWIPSEYDYRCHRMLISKELFVEAYNKWIRGEEINEVNTD